MGLSDTVADLLPLDRELKVAHTLIFCQGRTVADLLPLDRELKVLMPVVCQCIQKVADLLPLDRELKDSSRSAPPRRTAELQTYSR